MILSMSEILVILIICVLVLKPEDIPIIAKKFIEFKNYIFGIKDEIVAKIHQEVYSDIEDDIADINQYLEKIIEIEGKYDGDYNLTSVKKKYINLIKKTKNET
jgi:hypothetical protein